MRVKYFELKLTQKKRKGRWALERHIVSSAKRTSETRGAVMPY